VNCKIQSTKSISSKSATTDPVVGSSAVGSLQGDKKTRTSGISELRHRWLKSGRHHTAKSRRLVSNIVTTTHLWFQEALSWGALRLPAKSPSSNCPKPRQPTSQEGRATDPLRHSRGVVLEKPSGSASPGTSVVRGHTRQETAQRTSAATPADITGSHVTTAARSSLW